MEFFKGKGQKGNNPAKVDSRNRTLRRVSLFSAIIFIASLLVFNLLFDSLLGSKLKWDWSFGKMYSIGDVTRTLLAGMDKNVQITGLYEKGTDGNLAKIERVLEDYVQYSNGKIEVRYVDMDADPNIVKDLDPSGIKQFSAGTYVVKNMETKRLKIVTQEDLFQIDTEAYYNTGAVNIIGLTAESGFSGAIKYVTALVTPTVYSLQGHGEEDLAAYTRISTILQEYNSVDLDKTMNLSVNPVIPENCELILIMNPQKDVTADEQRVILDYLKKGGDMMVVTEYNTVSFPKLNEILAEYNIQISDSRIRENDTAYQYNQKPYNFFAESPVSSLSTTSFNQLLTINARGINVLANAKTWVLPEVILQTSAGAVSETNGDPTKASAPAVTTVGVISENTGWMSSNVAESSKVVVLGSKDMLSDAILLYTNSYNQNLFYFSINWVTDIQNTNLFITEKTLPSYVLQKGTQTSYIFASATALGIIPGALLVVGLIVYRRRKNL